MSDSDRLIDSQLKSGGHLSAVHSRLGEIKFKPPQFSDHLRTRNYKEMRRVSWEFFVSFLENVIRYEISLSEGPRN